VGHISLDAEVDDVNRAESYKISSFYVSAALQGGGLGRAAMDAVENMAISEPLCAKWLLLSTPADVQQTPQGSLASDKPQVCVKTRNTSLC
jgi:GNAT superfamily N-acetyltransferase